MSEVIEEQILDVLRDRGPMMLREMYRVLPYASDGGDCELDGPLLALERRGRIFSKGQGTTPHGAKNILWHLVANV